MSDGNKYLIIISLFISAMHFSKADISWFFERNLNSICPNKDDICSFNITYNNPYSPLIPGRFLSRSFFLQYNYFYLRLSVPLNQPQRQIYLEATEIRKNENVISNGDCYFINLTESANYELQIDYNLYYNLHLYGSFIQIKFLGLAPDFFMKVYFKFKLDLWISAYGIELNEDNSLWKSDIVELMDYEEELKEKIKRQNERKSKTIEKTNQILLNLFGKALHTDVAWKETKYTEIIPLPPLLLITVTMAVGLEESSDSLFKLNEEEETELTRAFSIQGDIYLDSGLNDFLGDFYLDSPVFNVIKIFLNQVRDLVLRLAFSTESFSVTISKSLFYPKITYTFRFYDEVTHKIFSEVEITIEVTNKYILDFVTATQDVLVGALNNIADFYQKYGTIIDNIINGIVVATIIFVLIGLAAASAVSALVGGGAVAILEAIKNIPFETPFQQALNFAPAFG